MNLLDILKQFKNIAPDPAFKESSKRAILAREPLAAVAPRGWSAQRTLWRILETGVAVALTGFFVLLITGAFSGSALAPVQYSAISPESLRAEAQAIDIQIQLANVTYAESAAESTAQIAGVKQVAPKNATSSVFPSAALAPQASSTASPAVTIDQALQSLAQ